MKSPVFRLVSILTILLMLGNVAMTDPRVEWRVEAADTPRCSSICK